MKYLIYLYLFRAPFRLLHCSIQYFFLSQQFVFKTIYNTTVETLSDDIGHKIYQQNICFLKMILSTK